MKLKITILLLIASPMLWSQSVDRLLNKANQTFQNGEFEKATQQYEKIPWQTENAETTLQLARLALLGNQFDKAESLLNGHLNNEPGDSLASKLLAETLYRQDSYERLPKLLTNAKTLYRMRQITHFTDNGLQPYTMKKVYKKVVIKMETIDFLPSVKMKVNGKEGLFIIDTGGGETIIDSEFAKLAGAIAFDQKEAVYAGGAKAKTTLGYVERLKLGKLEIEHLPVHIQPTQQYAQAVGGKEVSGIIGTNLLYHFHATLDYQAGELVLYNKTSHFKPKGIVIPMWLAADHLILAQGKLMQGEDQLFLVDTGMAGAGFTAPKSTLDAAGVQLPDSGSFEGQGAGGAVSVTPFMIDKVSLGALSNKNQIVGLFGPFPPGLEHSMGFRIGGLISHAFFRPYAVTFDFVKMRIYVRD
ncbi:MAG: tetratricopeptide repeat protein [Roseivirga sp.]|nr:tetratricopeptide repeat protein [Roseivirga sp.]